MSGMSDRDWMVVRAPSGAIGLAVPGPEVDDRSDEEHAAKSSNARSLRKPSFLAGALVNSQTGFDVAGEYLTGPFARATCENRHAEIVEACLVVSHGSRLFADVWIQWWMPGRRSPKG